MHATSSCVPISSNAHSTTDNSVRPVETLEITRHSESHCFFQGLLSRSDSVDQVVAVFQQFYSAEFVAKRVTKIKYYLLLKFKVSKYFEEVQQGEFPTRFCSQFTQLFTNKYVI